MKNSWGGRGNKDQLRKNMKYKRQVHCTTSKKIVNLILYADDAMLTEKMSNSNSERWKYFKCF